MPNRSLLALILMLMGLSPSVFAQHVNGMVMDVMSRKPIANAQIISPKATILTNSEGKFILSDIKLGAKIAVRIMGYETIEITVNMLSDTLQIYLKQNAIVLKEVEVKTERNYKRDSLDLRKEYASSFVYKGSSISDMFIEKVIWPDEYVPSFTNTRSTASMVSLDLLQIASLFGKKKVQKTRLKQTLIRDEQLNYVDEVFSKDKVKSLTGLEGEALIKFMNLYRPSALTLKKMTGYELTIYIKKSYQEFAKVKP